MATLRTDYVNDILAPSMDNKRQYRMIQNANGTVSFEDVTDYDQNGDIFSAGDVNGIDAQINENTGNITNNSNAIIANTTRIHGLTLRAPRDITSDLANLPTAIAEQNLEKYGYKIGDYFTGTGANPYKYWLADFDTFYASFTPASSRPWVNDHHVVLVVNTKTRTKWFTEDLGTTHTYGDSTIKTYMESTVLNKAKSDIASLFGGNWYDHIIRYRPSQTDYIAPLNEVQITGLPMMGLDSVYAVGSGAYSGGTIGDVTRIYMDGAYNQLEMFKKRFYSSYFDDILTSDSEGIWLKTITCGAKRCPSYIRRDMPLTYGNYPDPTTEYYAVGMILLK